MVHLHILYYNMYGKRGSWPTAIFATEDGKETSNMRAFSNGTTVLTRTKAVILSRLRVINALLLDNTVHDAGGVPALRAALPTHAH